MKRRVAVECYADEDVVRFLADVGSLPLQALHRYGQGQVVDAVLVRGTVEIGIVDEDPGKPHHPSRDRAGVFHETEDVAWRRRGNRHLFVIKPDLESCFFRSMERIQGSPVDLPDRPVDLQRFLNRPGPPSAHERFRQALGLLREESRRSGIRTFVADLERMLREV